MTDITNKVAFVTGAASGIGLALTKALLAKGCKVMMADINGDALTTAREKLAHLDQTAMIACDTSDADQVKAAAQATLNHFGKVYLVFNNAGVSLAGLTGKIALEDWRWIVDINIMGIVYGCEVFAPILQAQGEGGHIINTASMAGHVATAGMPTYFATKFAVVGYSEALQAELSPHGINISCLCPTWVKTNIHNTSDVSPAAENNREEFKTSEAYLTIKHLIENGMEPDTYAALCMQAIEANRLHVFNDPEARQHIVERCKSLLADYDANLKDLGLA